MKVSRRDFAALSVAAAGAALSVPEAALAAAAGDTPAAGADGILVPEHFVPTPKSISPAAQAMLRMKLPVEGVSPPESLSDTARWKAYQAASEQGMMAMVKPFSVKYPADVVTHRLPD